MTCFLTYSRLTALGHLARQFPYLVWQMTSCFFSGFDGVALPEKLQTLTFGEHFNQSILGISTCDHSGGMDVDGVALSHVESLASAEVSGWGWFQYRIPS